MAADTEHEDIGAGTENPVLEAGHHYSAHFGMLKANTVDGIVEFDVNSQVVAIELELVTGAQTSIFVKVGEQGGDGAIELQLPVPVLCGVGLIVDSVCWVTDDSPVLCGLFKEIYCTYIFKSSIIMH